MRVSKFPVTSKGGNKYYIEMFEGESFAYLGFNIIVYKRKIIRLPFNFSIKKDIKLEHYAIPLSEKEMLEDYGYNYIEMAKEYIKLYEEKNTQKIEYRNKVQKAKREFGDWDGIC